MLCNRRLSNVCLVRLGCFFVMLSVHSARVSIAADIPWVLSPPASGDWFAPLNWSGGVVPDSDDRAFIDNGGTALINSGAIDVIDMILGDSLTGTLSQTSGDLTVDDFLINSAGTYELSGGTLTVDSQFQLLARILRTQPLVVCKKFSFLSIHDAE